MGVCKCAKVALRRSVSAGSLSFLLRQGFGERVGGLSECSNARKRLKLWGSDSADDNSPVSGGDRESGDIFCEDRGEQLAKRISLSGYSKRLASSYASRDVV